MSADPIPPTIEWVDDHVRMIDQRVLPDRLTFAEASTVDEICDLIATMAVRGAPALGAAGAMGVALGHAQGDSDRQGAVERLVATRPTAVNLAWGARRAAAAADPVAEAQQIAVEDVERNRLIGVHGGPLVPDGGRVLTHCNAGALACVGYGTALGVVRGAEEQGRRPSVWVDETRPWLQGARLTAWELDRLDIPYTVIADVAAATGRSTGPGDQVVVGADPKAANRHVANKIGTYPLAVLAERHGVPFYVAAPTSTIDFDTPDGTEIVVEERDATEVLEPAGVRVTPLGAKGYNPAFDVTPADLVHGYVTERGILTHPSEAE
jgi:methylthioribose-1-phosphate isomerase